MVVDFFCKRHFSEPLCQGYQSMYKKGNIKTHSLTLEILTPIHIGTGEKLKNHYDYIVKNGKPFVVDKAATYDLILDQKKHDDERLYEKDFNIQDLIDIAGQDCGYWLKPISGFKPHQINECIKNAYLKPYIPGSSLKGAIRTAIIGTLLFNNEDHYKKYILTNNKDKSIADKQLIKKLLGSSPHKDIFRALRVSDVIFPAPLEPVLAEFKVENVYKSSVQTLYVEAIDKRQYGQFFMSRDEFLLNNSDKWNDSKIGSKPFFSSYNDLCKLINTYSMRYLENEIKFYDKGNIKEASIFIKNLLQKIQLDMKNNLSKAYLQMSWGAGWNNKTGSWLDKYLEEIRQRYKLGKGKGIFPRTRRLIYKDHQAETPGWVCISTEPIVIKPEKKTCSWVDEAMEKLCHEHHSKPDQILKSKVLAKEWANISEKELQKQVIDDIKHRWKEKGWMEGKPKGAIKKAIEIYGDIWEVEQTNETNK